MFRLDLRAISQLRSDYWSVVISGHELRLQSIELSKNGELGSRRCIELDFSPGLKLIVVHNNLRTQSDEVER